MRTALPVRRALAAVTATSLLGAGLLLLPGAASAAELALVSTSPADQAIVAEPDEITAVFNQFLTFTSSITVVNDADVIVCAGTGRSDEARLDTLVCDPLAALGTGTYTASYSATASGPLTEPDTSVTPLTGSFTFEVDATIDGPSPTIAPDPITPTTEAVTLVSGTTDPGATVTVTIDDADEDDGNAITQTGIADAGTGSYGISFDVSTLSDGTLTADVTAVDGVGNTASASDTATKDTAGPVAESTSPADEASVRPPSVVSVIFDEDVTNVQFLLFDQDDVGVAGTTTTDGSTVTFDPTGTLADGVYTAEVSVQDAVGNAGSAEFSFTVDSRAPNAPTVAVPSRFNGNLSVSGTGEPDAVVTIAVTGPQPLSAPVGSATATVGLDGTYAATVTFSVSVPDGTYSVSATQTDRAGNTSSSSATASTIKDSEAPETPSVTVTPDPIGSATDEEVTVSGTAEPGSSVTLAVTDGADGTASAGPTAVGDDGDYSFTSVDVSALADGTLTFRVTVTDGAGNDAAGQDTATKDTQAPTVVDLVVAGEDDPVTASNQTDVDVSGSTQSGSAVVVTLTDELDNTATRTVTAGQTGSFAVTFDASGLSDGELSVRASATDPAGNAGPVSAPTTVQKDATPPDAPTQEQGHVDALNEIAYRVFGETSPAATVTVTISDGNPVSGDLVFVVTATDSGGYDTGEQDLSSLSDGTLTISVTARDAVGNPSTTTEPRTKDSSAPGAPTVAIEEDPVVTDGDAVPATVSGDLAAADRLQPAGLEVLVTVSDGVQTVSGSTAPNLSGGYDLVLDVSSLADGPIRATATVRDGVGNTSPTVPSDFVEKNTVTLARTATTPADGAVVRTAPLVSATYNERLDTNRGATPASTVELRSRSGNLVAGSTSFDDGDRTIVFTPSSTLSDAGSPYTATFSVQDRVGETSTSSISFTVATDAAPTVTVTNPITAANEQQVRVLGTTEPGAVVTITLTDSATPTAGILETATADEDGAYLVEDIDVRTLADGAVTVSAQAVFTDTVVSQTATATAIKDTEGPVAIITSPADGATVAPPAFVEVQYDEQLGVAATSTVTIGAQEVSGTVSFVDVGRTARFTPDQPLVDGDYTATFDVTDQVGNPSTTSFDFSVDATAPATPVVEVPQTVNAAQAATFTVSISGVEPGDDIDVTVSGGGAADQPQTDVADENGEAEFVFDVSGYDDGPIVARATATDALDNTSGVGSDTSQKDTQAPIAPTVDLPARVNAADASAVLVQGTAEPGATATVTIRDEDILTDDVVFVAVAQEDGEYAGSADLRSLSDGILTADAVATDRAGNTSGTGPADMTAKDTTGPVAPSVTLTDPVTAANAGTATVSGTASIDTVRLTVLVDDTDPATPAVQDSVVAGEDGAYSFELDLSGLDDGSLTATVVPVDSFGNEGVSGEDSATKDTRGPQQVSASPATGTVGIAPADVRFAFDEDLADTATVTIEREGAPVTGTSAVQDDRRTVVFTPSAAFLPGSYAASAEVEDLVGNEGNGSTAFTVEEPQSSPSPDPSTSPTGTPTASASSSPTPTGDGGGGGGGGGTGGGGGDTGGSSPTPSVSPSPSVSPTASPSPSTSPSPSVAPRDGAGYVALSSPTRVLDSRDGTGTTRGTKRGRVVLDLSGRIPAGATAAVLNVTVTNPTATGFVVAYPDGNAKPGTSNVNFVAGQTQANEVVVGLPASRRVVLFVDSANAHVIADLVGFFTETERPDLGRVVTQAPVRVLDSRDGTGTTEGRKRGEVVLDLTGKLPAGATSVALNVTVAGPDARGFVVAYPTGTVRPGTSNVNFERGQTQANEVVVRLGTGANANKVSLFVDSATAALIADLVASVVPRDGAGNQLFTALAQPERVLDTRSGLGGTSGRRNGAISLTLPADVVPAGATGVVLNVTSTGASRTGFVSVYPAGTANPGTSNVNFRPGVNQANEVLTAISGGRGVTLFVGGGGTPLTHVVVDVVGYLTSTG